MNAERQHEAIEELTAAAALDALDEAALRELDRARASHGADCLACRRLEAEYAEVASQLGLALDPVGVSGGEEERLIGAALGGLADARTHPRVLDLRRPLVDRGARARRWLAGAAVAASLVLAGGAVGYSLARDGAPPGDRVVSFAPVGGRQLSVVFGEAEDAWVIGSGLQAPGEGRVYELWYRRSGSARMEPAGTFVPEGGTVVARVEVPERVDLLAVTVEPGFQRQPTSEPIFTASA